MKFFLYENYDDIEEEWASFQRESQAYQNHLGKLRGVLPDSVLALAKPYGMDDGLLVKVHHHRERHVLKLVLRCGDLQMGYYDLELVYRQARISPEHDRILAAVAHGTQNHIRHRYDLAHHELDMAEDGRIEHRLLFHPGVWFAIRCSIFEWKRIPRSDRRLPKLKNRYPGGPEPFA